MTYVQSVGAAAKEASAVLRISPTQTRNKVLLDIASDLCVRENEILAENNKDLLNAKNNGLSAAMIERLTLTPSRISAIAEGVRQVAALDDPIGLVSNMKTRPNGLIIGKKTVPLGVLALIYESRPNVTVDAAALCIKSANTVILRGGKEAFFSNKILSDIMRDVLAYNNLPLDCICFIEDTSRDAVRELMTLSDYLDALIPRGGANLIRSVVDNAKVPVIETGVGICHLYVDALADLDMAVDIAYNAKCSRPSVCNAIETLLVNVDIAELYLTRLKPLLDSNNVELRGCPRTVEILGDSVIPATDSDYRTEFNDFILAIKIVTDLNEAISFINDTGTGHSEAIVTADYNSAQRFLNEIDAAAVYVNASTRFTDGFEFGLGAEIGISTQKLHARGPMGIAELTSSKYIIYGSGQIR